MTPVEIAADLYRKIPFDRTFREDMEAYLIKGYVFNTPELFLMARPVSSLAPIEEIADPYRAFNRGEQDTWLVYLCAGSMVSVKKYLTDPPYALPKVAWARHHRLRFYRTDSLIATLCRPSSSLSSHASSSPGLALHLLATPILST